MELIRWRQLARAGRGWGGFSHTGSAVVVVVLPRWRSKGRVMGRRAHPLMAVSRTESGS